MAFFLQWNCRGYYANFEKLARLLKEHVPVCVCLQEIQLCFRKFFPPSGYDVALASAARGESDRGGAGILLRNSVPYTSIPLRTVLHAVAVRIHLQSDFTLCSIYLAPSVPVTKSDLQELFEQLPPPVVLLGDFNIRHPMWGDSVTSPNANILVDLLPKFSLGCLNSGLPTYERFDLRSSSCIDVSFVSLSILDRFLWSRSDFLHGSDHYPIFLHEVNPSPSPTPLSSWRYQRADWAGFYHATATRRFPSPALFPSIDEAFSYFTRLVLSAAEAFIPRSSTSKRPSTPWWSQECAQLNREKKKLFKLYKRQQSDYNLVAYKTAAARSRRINRRARKQYFRNYVSTVNDSTPLASVWRVVNKISNRCNGFPPIVLRYGDAPSDIISNPAVVADALGYAFAHNSSSLRYTEPFRHTRSANLLSPPDFGPLTLEERNLSYNHLFTLAEYQAALSSCKDGAVGPDGVSYVMLRHIHPTASAYLLDLYNRLWIDESFPSLWSTAYVIPIPKPNKDPHREDSMRPIVLSCDTCKLMEKMVANRLYPLLEGMQALSSFQFGFRRFRSTADPLIRFDHDVREAFSQRRMVLGVFFDLEKAYDTTWRGGILLKLHSLGLRGQLPCFLKRLMGGRQIQVRVSSAFSRPFLLEEGVPQGSVLSVLLFAVGINDVVSAVPGGVHCSLYADDLVLYLSGKGLPFLERQMQVAINNVSQWTQSRGFRFSVPKTTAVLFHRGYRGDRLDLIPSLSLYDSPLNIASQVKFLGITFDHKLTYAPHIKSVKTSCRRPLDILHHLSHKTWGADRKTLLRLFTSLVQSRLDYGSAVYGQASPHLLKLLDPIQNEGIRIATGAFRSSPKISLEAEANIMPLSLRREFLMCSTYVRLLKPEPSALSPLLETVEGCTFRWPFAEVVRTTFASLHIPLDRVLPIGCIDSSPWLFPKPRVCTALTHLQKTGNTALHLRTSFLSHACMHRDATPIYTDGSKSAGGVGAAVVFPDCALSHSLPTAASVFTAELWAMILALSRILRLNTDSSYVLYSDSRSALDAIKDIFSRNPLVLNIQRFLQLLHSRRKSVCFCWVPSHVNIAGNEKADGEAKMAALVHRSASSYLPSSLQLGYLPGEDYLPVLRKGFCERWQLLWTASYPNKLLALKPDLGPWKSSCTRNRLQEVSLARLRIGHTHLSHGHLMTNDPPPNCSFCRRNIIPTVHHLLLECPFFGILRNQCFPSLRSIPLDRRLPHVLSESPTFNRRVIFEFLSRSRLIYQL